MTKLCKDYRHCVFLYGDNSDLIGVSPIEAYCIHASYNPDICSYMRAEDSYCGKEGKYWEAKDDQH